MLSECHMRRKESTIISVIKRGKQLGYILKVKLKFVIYHLYAHQMIKFVCDFSSFLYTDSQCILEINLTNLEMRGRELDSESTVLVARLLNVLHAQLS